MKTITSFFLGATALHSKHISSTLFTRIAAIAFIYAVILSACGLAGSIIYIQSIGSGVSIYSGIFHVTDLNLDLGQLNTPFLGFPTFIKTLVKYILLAKRL